MRIWLLCLFVGLLLCLAYNQYVYQTCRATGLSPAACLVVMGDL